MNNETKIFWLWLVAALLASVVAVRDVLPHLNADTVYAISLYRDIFERSYDVWSWHTTPTPYFFPDVMGLFVAFKLFEVTGLSFVFYGMIYTLVLSLIIEVFLRGYGLRGRGPTVVALLLTTALVIPDSTFLIHWMMPTLHGGTLITGLMTWIIARNPDLLPKNRYLLGLLIGVLGFAVFSDVLLVPHFLMPAVFAWYFVYRKEDVPKPRWWKIYLVVSISVPIVSAALTKFGLIHVGGGTPHLFAKSVSKSVKAFIEVMPELAFQYGVFLIVAGIALFVCFREWRKNETRWFLICVIISVGCAFPLQVLNGTFLDLTGVRQTLVVFVVPAIMIIALFRPKVFWADFLVAPFLCLIFGIAIYNSPGEFELPYTEEMACIEQQTSQWQVRHGLGDYWQAKKLNELGRSGIWVNQLTDHMKPYHWISNPSWFAHGPSGEPLTYQFVVVNRLLQSRVRESFGEPHAEVACDNVIVSHYSNGIQIHN